MAGNADGGAACNTELPHLFTEDRHPKSDCADVGETNVLKAGKPAQSLKQGNHFMERNEVQTLRKLELVVNGLLIAVALLTIVGAPGAGACRTSSRRPASASLACGKSRVTVVAEQMKHHSPADVSGRQHSQPTVGGEGRAPRQLNLRERRHTRWEEPGTLEYCLSQL